MHTILMLHWKLSAGRGRGHRVRAIILFHMKLFTSRDRGNRVHVVLSRWKTFARCGRRQQ